MKRLNVIHASVFGLAVCAAVALLSPATLLGGLGVQDPSFPMQGIIRMAGVMVLGLGAVLWSARRWLYSAQGAPTLRVLGVISGMSAVMLLLQQIGAFGGPTQVVPVIFMGLLSVDYVQSAERLTRRPHRIS
ncbi:MAG TPA: hypothetical protein VLE53_04115 [Gemmatimonadaceae bacterium]|nr:hypothetical protein [Gemmatimonadaceae bacterium]